MKTLKLINPVIKSDVLDDTFTGENTMEVAKSAFKLLAKYMVTTKSNRFIYTLKDVNSDQEYHFDGQKNVVKRGKANLNIKKININKTGGGESQNIKVHLKGMAGGSKQSNTSSSSNISDDLLKELSVDSEESNMSNESDDSEQSSSSDIYGGHSEGKKKRRKRRRKKKSLERAKRKSRKKSRKKSGKKSKSSKKGSETYEEWLRRRYLFPANTYFFYDPLYYYLPDYTSYIFDRNVFIPNLYYSLYPYSQSILYWV